VTWGTPVQSFVFLGLLVFELEPMYATSDRRTDRRTTDADDRLMPPPPLRGRGHNKVSVRKIISERCKLMKLCHINCSSPVFKTHCICTQSVHNAIVLAKFPYASHAWGFATADDKKRLEAFVRRRTNNHSSSPSLKMKALNPSVYCHI